MIYVLEVDGAPLQNSRASLYSYTDRARAVHAARSMGARVVEYRPGVADEQEEDAWREAGALQAQRDEARQALANELREAAALRGRFGGREGETLAELVARLYRARKRLKKVVALSLQQQRDDGECEDEEVEP